MTSSEPVKVQPKYVAQKCPVCNGFGTLKNGTIICHGCKGLGWVKVEAVTTSRRNGGSNGTD